LLILRLVVVLAVLVIAASLATYLLTGNLRYRVFAWKVFKVLLAAVLVFLALLLLERAFITVL
jgi:hypothetical protein